jgi:hypothetical protein
MCVKVIPGILQRTLMLWLKRPFNFPGISRLYASRFGGGPFVPPIHGHLKNFAFVFSLVTDRDEVKNGNRVAIHREFPCPFHLHTEENEPIDPLFV